MQQTTIYPQPAPRRKGCVPTGCLGFSGITLLAMGMLIVVYGFIYGYVTDKEFYERHDAYIALQDERDVMQNRCDSLTTLVTDLEAAGDTMEARRVEQELTALQETDEYMKLLGTPEPPMGFSTAYIVTVIMCVIAIPILAVGTVFTIMWRLRKRKFRQ